LSGRGGLDPYEADDDWARYGGARRKPSEDESEELLRDDPFADYRSENDRSPAGNGEPRRSRARSNLLGALVAVAVVAVVAALVNLAAPRTTPAPSPDGTPRPIGTLTPSPLLPAQLNTMRLARVAVTIPIPIPVSVPDRAFAFDDGARMYLAGNMGALTVDVAGGTVSNVWSGTDFPKGLRRVVFDGGVWVSSWPAGYASCGPPCWDKAATYRIDPATGAVTYARQGEFLVGGRFDGVFVASVGRLRTLDPDDGSEVSSFAWKTAGEPRLGCGGVWSVELGDATELVAINDVSGDQIGHSSLAPSLAYGPVSSEGLCWMMSGRDGASAGETRLALLSANGSVISERNYESPIVILDSEFWRLAGDGSIQRFEAVSTALGYGPIYILPVSPQGDDPSGIFSAVGSMWLYRGQELVGFDVVTGSSNAGK
jgi:hypothetical protein